MVMSDDDGGDDVFDDVDDDIDMMMILMIILMVMMIRFEFFFFMKPQIDNYCTFKSQIQKKTPIKLRTLYVRKLKFL